MESIRNITVSGRIASGTTTLAKGIAEQLDWQLFEGGVLFDEYFNQQTGTDKDRADSIDLGYEEMVKEKLRGETHQVIQSHLAGFDAQEIAGVYKILVVCEDAREQDRIEVRIDRLINRKDIPMEEAKREIIARDQGNLAKWRRLYANNDQTWVYWDKRYYDLVINTFELSKHEALEKAMEAINKLPLE
jgi:cytidylate kinase